MKLSNIKKRFFILLFFFFLHDLQCGTSPEFIYKNARTVVLNYQNAKNISK